MGSENYTFIDLFAGIGGTRLGFERNGCECVFSSEIDEDAVETYEHNFGEEPAGDITEIDAEEIPDHDILVAGFPCPTFSIIGKREGFDGDKGELFFEIERLLEEKRPHAFMLENVKNLKSIGGGELLDEIVKRLESLGYYVHWEVLNALDFGLPQKRERIILVGFQENYKFEYPDGVDEEPSLEEVLEDNPPENYEASDYIKEKRRDAVEEDEVFEPAIWHENKSGNISVMPHSPALRAHASHNYILVNGERLPSPREMLRLQGFPEDYELATDTKTGAKKLLGNTVPVPMIEAVAEKMIEAMERGETTKVGKQATIEEISS